MKQQNFPSELRYDLVSRDWVVIATGRAKRPEMFKQKGKKAPIESDTKNCPFCDVAKLGKPLAVFGNGNHKTNEIPEKWTTIVIPNKFPAVVPAKTLQEKTEGKIFKKMLAVGFHEVVIYRDHAKDPSQFSLHQLKEMVDAYQARYLALKKEKFVNHISIFHNHGPSAGASITHPHSQIITTPLVDTDLQKSAQNAEHYFKEHGQCAYCSMAKAELKLKKRIVFENKDFFVLCPFASKAAFEMIISPKKHLSNFEKITEEEKIGLTESFKAALGKMRKALSAPDYNFYLHTAPSDGQEYPFYHWHWTIIPKTSIQAGFEIGTRMEISTITPEAAALYLSKQK